MEFLPREILIKIFLNLDGHSLFQTSKTCELWSQLINESIEITSKFSFKVHSGENFMPDFMDYNYLRRFHLTFMFSTDNHQLKVRKFWPKLRSTEICDIIDETGIKFDEILEIFNQHGRLWRQVVMHDVKLQKVSHFAWIFGTFANVQTMKLNSVNVESACDEVQLDGLRNLTNLEVTSVNWLIFKALKHCRNIEILNVTSKTSTNSDDFNELLLNNENLRELYLFGTPKIAIASQFHYKFQLTKLVIDRTDSYKCRNDVDVMNLSDFLPFLESQRNSLKNFKFKGGISEKCIAMVAKNMKLTRLNVHFIQVDKMIDEPVTAVVTNFELEKLNCIGSMYDLRKVIRFFPALKGLKLKSSSTSITPFRIDHLIYHLPDLQSLKFVTKIQIPSTLDPTVMRFNNLVQLRIVLSESCDVTKILKICPRLKELTLLTEFLGDIVEDECVSYVETMCLCVEGIISSIDIITKLHQVLQCMPNLKKLTLNSELMGKLIVPTVKFPALEYLKIDFTSTLNQCENMYEMINCCPNLKTLEVNSRLIGKVNITETFNHMESITVMGFSEDFESFDNLTNFLKFCPNIRKIDFWLRGSGNDGYRYLHGEKVKEKESLNLQHLTEFRMWRFHKTEEEILIYFLRSCENLKNLKIGTDNEDINKFNFECILSHASNIEELSFGRNFEFNCENLTIIKRNLRKLKRLEIFAVRPLEVRQILREVFGSECEIEFVFNPQCLEEWSDDDIVRI